MSWWLPHLPALVFGPSPIGSAAESLLLMAPRPIPVVVAGALGRMGAEVVKAVNTSGDCVLVGAIDTTAAKEGVDVGEE